MVSVSDAKPAGHAARPGHGGGGTGAEMHEDAPRTDLKRVFFILLGVALFLIVFAQLATRSIKDVPEGLQNFWEWMVESLHEFLQGIIGHVNMLTEPQACCGKFNARVSVALRGVPARTCVVVTQAHGSAGMIRSFLSSKKIGYAPVEAVANRDEFRV